MILLILPCVLIGYLCGSALAGLGAGIVVFALTVWANEPYRPSGRLSRRARRRIRKRAGRS